MSDEVEMKRRKWLTVLAVCGRLVCLALAAAAIGLRHYQIEAIEARQLREFGRAVASSLPRPASPSAQAPFPDQAELGTESQPPVSEATGKQFVYRPVTPSGERIFNDVRGVRIIAWSAVPPLGSRSRACMTNGLGVYWLTDDEVDWASQTWITARRRHDAW